MNFKHDLAEISRKELNKAGIVVPSEWDDYTVCMKHLDIHHRFFDSSVSYMVAYSKELKKKLPTLTSKEQYAIKDIEERLKTQKSIVPYMSKQIRAISVSKSDFLLKIGLYIICIWKKILMGAAMVICCSFNHKGDLFALLMCIHIPREVHGLIESYLISYMTTGRSF